MPEAGERDREFSYFALGLSPEDYKRRIERIFALELSAGGLRLTTQRRRILDALLKARRHLSEDEIYSELAGFGIGRATVFRTLKVLKKCGLVEEVLGDGRPRFEVRWRRPHHDHLICVDCGRIQEIRWPALEAIQERACRKAGFAARWHRHEIFGLCRSCSKRQRSE